MAVNVARLIGPKQLENALTTQYTAPGSGNVQVRVDKASFTNTTGGAQTIDLYLTASGGGAAAADQVTKSKTILPGQTWNCPDIVGHVLSSGDFLSTNCSAAASITAVVDGTIFS